MANGILSNILGFDPVALQQQRQQQLMAPIQQAQNPYERMGAAIGTALGSSLFNVQDPRLKRASEVTGIYNEVMQNFDVNDPGASYQALAQTLAQAGYGPEATFAAQEAAKFKKEAKRTVVAPGSSVIDETGRVIFTAPSKDKVITPGQDIVRAAGSLGIPIPEDVSQFTTEQWVAIDNKIRQTQRENAAATAAKLNFTDPKSQVAAITEINGQLKPLTQQIQALDQSIALRRNDKSPFSQKLFEQTVAGAFGDSQKAAAEITRLVNTGNLGQRVTNTLGLFLSGQIGTATKEDQLESLNAIRDYVSKQYDDTASVYRPVLGEQADKVAPLAGQRFQRPKLPPNQQYIPIDVVNQYNLKKGQRLKKGDKEFVYNGDGTITILKGQ